MKTNKSGLSIVTIIGLMAFTSTAPSVNGQIIPLPGQKQIDKASATPKLEPQLQNKKNPKKGSGALIPLPVKIKPADPVIKEEAKTDENSNEKPLIKITPPKPVEAPVPDGDFPIPPDEVTISSGDSLGDLLPNPPPPEVSVASGTEGSGTMPIFPKDTSSAIFMVMKTWQCDNYDGNTLLTHALEVYGKEADDVFQIQGLSPEGGTDFMVTVEEEDITLDELLDILATKSGRDWGVDIPSRTIYFYPKGVKTETFNVW